MSEIVRTTGEADSVSVNDLQRQLRSQKSTTFYELVEKTYSKRQSGRSSKLVQSQESMAESMGIKPPKFYGKPNEDADAFTKAFDRYTKFREITDGSKKLNLFAVLLHESAADWLDSLPDESKSTFALLSKAFAERYNLSDSLKYKYANDLFAKKQSENETVDEYITRMRKLARLVAVDDNMLRYALISGFKPYITAQVTLSKPESVDKIVEVARLAELTMPKIVESDVHQHMAAMQAEMQRLTTKIDKVMTTPIRSRSPSPIRQVQFARSQSPRIRTELHQRSSRGNEVYPRSNYNQRRQRDDRLEQRNHLEQRTSTVSCTRCARNHGKQDFCPARDPTKVCHYCRRPGHFQAACFSAPRQF